MASDPAAPLPAGVLLLDDGGQEGQCQGQAGQQLGQQVPARCQAAELGVKGTLAILGSGFLLQLSMFAQGQSPVQ